jgi:hypothetical protein
MSILIGIVGVILLLILFIATVIVSVVVGSAAFQSSDFGQNDSIILWISLLIVFAAVSYAGLRLFAFTFNLPL